MKVILKQRKYSTILNKYYGKAHKCKSTTTPTRGANTKKRRKVTKRKSIKMSQSTKKIQQNTILKYHTKIQKSDERTESTISRTEMGGNEIGPSMENTTPCSCITS